MQPPLRLWLGFAGAAGIVFLALAIRSAAREPIQVLLPVTPNPDITVHVAGAARFPGVYTLPAGARAQDALEAAGGPVAGADVDRLNLAARLKDGDQVWVPQRGDQAADSTGQSQRLNLNTATQADLERLPGIGPARARNILASRADAGSFADPLELVDRKLVPLSVYQQIKDLVSTR